MTGVVLVVLIGVIAMGRDGPLDGRYGNRLMRLRVLFQGIAPALLAVFATFAFLPGR